MGSLPCNVSKASALFGLSVTKGCRGAPVNETIDKLKVFD